MYNNTLDIYHLLSRLVGWVGWFGWVVFGLGLGFSYQVVGDGLVKDGTVQGWMDGLE